MSKQTAIETLTALVLAYGPILTVRVSSAKPRGSAKQYRYWGAVRYEIRLSKAGWPMNVALERAGSDRRVERLADEDAQRIADEEGRVHCQWIGSLSEQAAARVLLQLSV